MKNIRDAFAAFWGGFSNRSVTPSVPLKAFPSGYAVEYGGGAPASGKAPELPYITYEAARPAFGDFVILTSCVWTRGVAWSLVDDILAQAAEKIPESGARLDLGADGVIMLYRSKPFIQYLPPEGGDMLTKAGLIRVTAKNYVI